MLGIDFGTTALRAVELTAGGQPQVRRYCSESLPAGWVVDRQIKDIQNTAEALEGMLSRGGIRTRCGTTAVAFSNAITKTFTVDAATREDDLEEMVEAEVGRAVAYPLEECSIDFYRSAAPSGGRDHVRFVVCHRTGVQDQVSVLETAGLEPTVVDIDAYSLGLLHDRQSVDRPGTPGALLDLGHVSSRLIIIRDGEIAYTSDLSHGGRQLLEMMQLHCDLEPAQALEALTGSAPPVEDFAGRVLTPFADALGNEVLRALKMFQAGVAESPPLRSLQLIGGGALVPGIAPLLGRHLDVPVRRIKTLPAVNIARHLRDGPFAHQLPAFALAASLALRGTR